MVDRRDQRPACRRRSGQPVPDRRRLCRDAQRTCSSASARASSLRPAASPHAFAKATVGKQLGDPKMPEGDTIYRAARSLNKALAGHVVTKFDTAYAHLSRVDDDTPIAGRTIERCEAAGQTPADRVQRRPHPADAHADERLVAPLSPRRAMVARAAGDARADRHGRLGRGGVRCARCRIRDGAAAPGDRSGGRARARPARAGVRSR